MNQFDRLPAKQRYEYEDRARYLIYEGLEPAWKHHDKMLSILARALYKIDELKKDGHQ